MSRLLEAYGDELIKLGFGQLAAWPLITGAMRIGGYAWRAAKAARAANKARLGVRAATKAVADGTKKRLTTSAGAKQLGGETVGVLKDSVREGATFTAGEQIGRRLTAPPKSAAQPAYSSNQFRAY